MLPRAAESPGEGAPGARHRSERPRLRAPVTLSIGFPDLLPDQPGDLRPHDVREALQPLLEGKHSGVQSSWGANEGRNRHQGTPGETLGEGSAACRWAAGSFPFPTLLSAEFQQEERFAEPPSHRSIPVGPSSPRGTLRRSLGCGGTSEQGVPCGCGVTEPHLPRVQVP